MEPTLHQALNKVLGASNITTPTGITIPKDTTMDTLLQQTVEHYNTAKEALIAGDIEAYGREMKNVDKLLQELEKQIGAK